MKHRTLHIASFLSFFLYASPSSASGQTAYSKIVTNDAPFLYWNFDEASGPVQQKIDVAPPSQDTSNDLVPVGATRVSHASISSGLTLGNAAKLSGQNYFFAEDLNPSKTSLVGPYAIEFWMQVQGEDIERRNDYILSFGPGGGNAPAVIYDYVGAFSEDNGLELYAGTRTDVGPIVSDQNWHHVVFVYYGNGIDGVSDRADAYLDGVHIPFIRAGFTSPINLTSRFMVGTSAPQFPGDGFEGHVDEVAVYDLSALTTEDDVLAKANRIASTHFARASSGQPYAESVLAENPFLYWTFDEPSGNAVQKVNHTPPPPDTTANDLVPSEFAVRVQHSEIQSGLRLGGAVQLDGVSSFSAADLDAGVSTLPGPWGVEFWVQVLGDNEGFSRNDYLMSFGAGGGNSPSIIYDYIGAEVEDSIELFAGNRTSAGAVLADANWHHLFLVYYGNGTVGVADRAQVFLDGVAVSDNNRGTFTSPLTLADRIIIGNSPVPADGLEGIMDEVAIYDFSSITTEAALQTKVAQLAAAHFAAAKAANGNYSAAITNDAPLLYWNFNETEGNAIQQMPIQKVGTRPTANDLMPTAGATRVSHESIASGLNLGNAGELNGLNFFVADDLAAPKPTLTAPYMIEFWMQVLGEDVERRNDYIMSFGGGGGNAPAVLYDYVGGASPDNGLELFAGGRTGEGPSISDSNWHHVVIVYYGDGTLGVADRADFYLDGVKASENVRGTFTRDIDVGTRFVVGGSAPQFPADGFEGRLDEIAIYDLSGLATEAAVTAKAADIASRHYNAARNVVVDRPELSIQKSGNQLVISWAPASGYVLESITTLTNPTWIPVAQAPTLVNGRNQVTVPITGTAQFFRLKK